MKVSKQVIEDILDGVWEECYELFEKEKVRYWKEDSNRFAWKVTKKVHKAKKVLIDMIDEGCLEDALEQLDRDGEKLLAMWEAYEEACEDAEEMPE